jgi:hypothetical protein
MLPVVIDALGEFVAAQVWADRERARQAVAAADLDASGTWAVDGWSSMNMWMQEHTHLSGSDSRRLVHEGRFLRRFETVGDAALAGTLSSSLVSMFRRVVSPAVVGLFDRDQVWLVPAIAPLHPVEAATALQEWLRRANEATDTPAEFTHEDRMFKASRLEDGSMVGQFALDPFGAEALDTALSTARTWDKGDERTQVQTLADALHTIAAFFNANHDADGTPRHHAHVEWLMQTNDHNTLHPECSSVDCMGHGDSQLDPAYATTITSLGGYVMPDWVAAAISCDCTINRVLTAKSAVLDYGITVYTPPKDLYRAVIARDKCCRFPGCRRKAKFTEAHHIVPWPIGPTSLDNLILLCAHHHHLVHRQQWDVQLIPGPDAEVIFTSPDRKQHRSVPWTTPHITNPTTATT